MESRELGELSPFKVPCAERYQDDAANQRGERPLAIYAPENAKECSLILRTLSEAGQPCVVQGGRTGLSGGARVRKGEVVLSTERMRRTLEIDEAAGLMYVGAGTLLEEAQNAARDAGWLLAADLGARGSATIGGMIATNAGGPLAVRYGTFRNQVIGLEAVLADGTIIDRMSGLWKDNTGYNLPQMIMGNEGTLAVITAAALRLHAPAQLQMAALCACPTIEAAIDFLPTLRRRFGPLLQACEFMMARLLEMSSKQKSTAFPFAESAGCYLLVEVASSLDIDLESTFSEVLAEAFEQGVMSDAVLSQSEKNRLDFWSLREGCNEAIDRTCSAYTSLDLSLPIAAIPSFLSQAAELIGVERTAYAFGHLGDGNIHYILSGASHKTLIEPLFRLTNALGGVVSAEHGLGVDKAGYLGICRSEQEIDLMRRIKAAFDPKGILNPGRVLPLPTY